MNDMQNKLPEVTFKIFTDEDGVLCASGIDHRIYTYGKTWNMLIKNLFEAVECYFEVPYSQVNIVLKIDAPGNASGQTTGCQT